MSPNAIAEAECRDSFMAFFFTFPGNLRKTNEKLKQQNQISISASCPLNFYTSHLIAFTLKFKFFFPIQVFLKQVNYAQITEKKTKIINISHEHLKHKCHETNKID